MQPQIESNELSLDIANKSTEVFCYRCGGRDYLKKGRNKNGKLCYFCNICRRQFVEKLNEKYKPRGLEVGDDVWDASELGVKINGYTGKRKLVFAHIKQDWLKDATKKFVKYQAINKSLSYLQRSIYTLNKLSDFLETYYPTTNFGTINREVIIDFICFLSRGQIQASTKNQILSCLKLFLKLEILIHGSKYLLV